MTDMGGYDAMRYLITLAIYVNIDGWGVDFAGNKTSVA